MSPSPRVKKVVPLRYKNVPISPRLVGRFSRVASPRWSKAKATTIMTAHRPSCRKTESGPKAVRKLWRADRLLFQPPRQRHSRQPRCVETRAGIKATETVRGKTTAEKASHRAILKNKRPAQTTRDLIMVSLMFIF
jgi:hypothetical protein